MLAIFMLLGACGITEPPTDEGTTGTDGSSGGTGTGDTGTGDTGTSDTGTQDNNTGDTGAYSNGTSTGGIGAGETGDTGQPQTTLENSEIFYESGGWKIYGTLYESESATPTKTIILVHEFDKDRSSWPISFIEKLHNQFPEAIVLAIDLRGHGKSTNLGTWADFDAAAYKDMKTDIISADKYIGAHYPDAEEYYVVGASLGSTAAILAGEQEKTIDKVVMISPGMEYKGVDITRAAEDYSHDVMAVAANGDTYSANAVSEIDDLRNVEYTEVVIYPGSDHGTDLFAATAGGSEPLGDKIVEFLK
ncbi:MAG: alpha/beta fold hydrolase [Candidatus ainarchaeum sp.]|nr:alpha/beta fold hydrolase [Candidatus ainarchaeum sp.]